MEEIPYYIFGGNIMEVTMMEIFMNYTIGQILCFGPTFVIIGIAIHKARKLYKKWTEEE